MPSSDTENGTNLEYRLLGSFQVIVDGVAIHCGGLKQRSVLAMLVLDANRPVTNSRLIEGLWADDPPNRALSTIQVYISGLRKLLPISGGASPIATRTNGYVLDAPTGSIDVQRFTANLEAARDAQRWQDDRLTLHHLDMALELWQGQPLADFIDQPFAPGPAVALQQQYEGATEQRIEVMLRLGEHRVILPELEEAVSVTPLRESLWRLLMLALYRSGRQADALNAFQNCRDVLLDELGVNPSPETKALELAILEHDPAIAVQQTSRIAPKGDLTIPAGHTGTIVLHIDGEFHQLADTMLIGRSEDCDIIVDEQHVSRHHAEIRRSPSGWLLTDLSLNGTLVNGQRCAQRSLMDGDEIVIGSRSIRVEARS